MIEHTTFIAQFQAEDITNPSTDRIIISITGPIDDMGTMGKLSRRAILDEQAWRAILRLEFHDSVKSKVAIDAGNLLFDEDMALAIFHFLKEHEENVTQAVVHCEGGVSRSAAVSKFIAQIYGLEFPENYTHFNRHVFETLYKAYGRCAYGEGSIKPTDLPGVYYQNFIDAQGEPA